MSWYYKLKTLWRIPFWCLIPEISVYPWDSNHVLQLATFRWHIANATHLLVTDKQYVQLFPSRRCFPDFSLRHLPTPSPGWTNQSKRTYSPAADVTQVSCRLPVNLLLLEINSFFLSMTTRSCDSCRPGPSHLCSGKVSACCYRP